MEVILISGKKNKLFNFSVQFWLIIVACIVVCAIVISFVYSLFSVTATEVDRTRLRLIIHENQVVRRELSNLENEISNLGSFIDSLESYDQKLRIYASLKPIEQSINEGSLVDSTEPPGNNLKNLYELSRLLDNLLYRAQLQQASYEELLSHLDATTTLRNHTPSITPVQGWFVSGYGYRLDPFTGNIKMHEGIDIAGPIGTPIIAPAYGTVTTVSVKPGFGLTLEIDHGYGYTTFYAHCQRSNVTVGSAVKRGDIIAFLGETGKSTGPHVHYEIRMNGIPRNPLNYILITYTIAD